MKAITTMFTTRPATSSRIRLTPGRSAAFTTTVDSARLPICDTPMITRPRTARPRWTCIAARGRRWSTSQMSSCATWRPTNAFVADHNAVSRPTISTHTLPVERRRIVGQLLAEHRDVLERAVDDPLLEVLVVLQDESEDRGRHEQQREDRQEAEERQQRRVAPRLVATPAVERVDDHVDDGAAAAAAPSPDRSSSTPSGARPAGIVGVGQVPVDRRLAVVDAAPRWRG